MSSQRATAPPRKTWKGLMVGSGDRVSWLAAPECFGLSRCGSGRVFGVAGSLSGSEFFGVAGCGMGLVGWKSCPGDGVAGKVGCEVCW